MPLPSHFRLFLDNRARLHSFPNTPCWKDIQGYSRSEERAEKHFRVGTSTILNSEHGQLLLALFEFLLLLLGHVRRWRRLGGREGHAARKETTTRQNKDMVNSACA